MTQTCSKEKWEEEEKKIVKSMSKYKTSQHCETWHKSPCPNCAAVNWIFMNRKMEACKCHKCEKVFWISEEIYEDYKTSLVMGEVFDFDPKKVEDIFIGMEKPD